MNKIFTFFRFPKTGITTWLNFVLATVFLLFLAKDFAYSQTSTLYDFNTAGQLTGVFNSSGPDFANVVESTTGGIGFVRIKIDYGDPVINPGVEFGTKATPPIGDGFSTRIQDGSGTDAFEEDITSIIEKTTYYFSTIDIKNAGKNYDSVESFKTGMEFFSFVTITFDDQGLSNSNFSGKKYKITKERVECNFHNNSTSGNLGFEYRYLGGNCNTGDRWLSTNGGNGTEVTTGTIDGSEIVLMSLDFLNDFTFSN